MDKAAADAVFTTENRIMEILASIKAIQHVLYEANLTDQQSLAKIQKAFREELNNGLEWQALLADLGKLSGKQ